MTWLQGGPFLEISFLVSVESGRRCLVDNILTKLKYFKPSVTLAISGTELKEKINRFEIGYPEDDKDLNTKVYHQTQIPIYVETDIKRKSILSLRQVSNKLIAVDFWFYGSKWDDPDWNQAGITNEQIPIFKNFLHKLFDTFDFVVGTMAYEVSVTDIFDTDETWPDEKYNLDNIRKQFLSTGNYFDLVIANKKYFDLQDINGILTDGHKQTLEVENTAHNKGLR